MSLENLLKIGQLKSHPPDAGEIERLLTAAERNLRDARVTSISAETRFDAAYKAIMQNLDYAKEIFTLPDRRRPHAQGDSICRLEAPRPAAEGRACFSLYQPSNRTSGGSLV